jgi:nuclear transport factor 2 (NTF2) superfamily protein
MTHDDAARWLDAYVEAWRSYDPAAIGALFAADAEYRYHPWDEPLHGREAIVASWTGDQDAPGSWEAEYAPWAVDGNRVVATGTSRYVEPARTYHNVFLIEFDANGTAASFTEVFAEER